jgi:predicted AAA+ superfamily ATPase
MNYLRRVVDDELDALLPGVPAIAIEGARAVGKTFTATNRVTTIHRLDDPATYQSLRADPSRLARDPRPVLVDEWQRMPETWDVVRRAVDADSSCGRFLLTGSASPKNPPTHTGAGRIISLRMRPMSLPERGVEAPTVSLAEILTGSRPQLEGHTKLRAEDYAREIIRSGFPGIRTSPDRAIRAMLDGYVARIIDHDFEDLGGTSIRNPEGLRRWLIAYAAAEGTTASYEKIRDAASGGQETKPTKVTTLAWLDTLRRIGLADPLPAWFPARNNLSVLAQSPRHHLVDPALAMRLRGVDLGTLMDGGPDGPFRMRDGTYFGALFEALVTLGVRVFAQAAEARVYHMRTQDGGHEVDLIVERADSRVVAIEVKLAQAIVDEDVRHLRWLRDRLGADLLDAIVVSTGPTAYRREDGIGVVPAALLGS